MPFGNILMLNFDHEVADVVDAPAQSHPGLVRGTTILPRRGWERISIGCDVGHYRTIVNHDDTPVGYRISTRLCSRS
jgi:hypothetical protein